MMPTPSKNPPTISIRQMLASFLPDLHLSDRQLEPLVAIDNDAASFILLAWGRRSGKTLIMCVIALWHALPRPEFDAYLLAGESRQVVCVATSLRQSRRLIARLKTLIAMSPVLSAMIESTTADEIRLKHAVTITAYPANSAGDRGDNASAVLLDEYAHHGDALPDSAGSAEGLLASLLPAAAQFHDLATIVIASTPSGDSNHFAKLYRQTTEEADPTARAYSGATWEINPAITESSLMGERRLLGDELYRQEFMADFLSGGGRLLSWEAIKECVVDRGELEHHSASDWVAGVDPAFASDLFGVCLLGRDRTGRLVVGAVRGLAGSSGPSFEARRQGEDELLADVAVLCRRFRCPTVVTDVHKAAEISTRLAACGIDVVQIPFAGEARRLVWASLRLAIDEAQIELPNDPDLLAELRAITVRPTRTGQTIELPRIGRSHCDRAVALALAVHHHTGGELWPADAGAAVAQPGRGWSDHQNQVADDGPATGSREYWDLDISARYALAMKRSGVSAGDAPGFLIPGPTDRYGDAW
jgi:Terminase large subunit, T4likevirus-type, N-terminal